MQDTATASRPDQIDAELRVFVDALNAGYAAVANFATLPLPERRAAAERIRAPWRAGGPDMARTTDVRIAGRRARIHRPTEAETLPALLYLHGGGWTMFSIDTHDRLMREYAARAGVAVVGLDYSLSPEATFPAALDETVAAIGWIRDRGGVHGLDGRRIAVGGDSAGGNLALAACLRLRDAGADQPQAMLLNYGAFAADHLPSYAAYGGPDYMLTIEEMDRFWADYTRAPADLDDPLVAPAKADLAGLPPAFMTIAECDILRDVNRQVAERLEQAGVPVNARIYAGAPHSFLEAVSVSSLADLALDEASGWLRSRLASG